MATVSQIYQCILLYYTAFSASGDYSGFAYQSLVKLPANIPNETTTLDLTGNLIKTVDYFPQLPIVEYLRLQNNLLEEFPNLENISTTIKWIHLDDNRISLVRAERLAALTNIERIYLKRNKIKMLPQVDTLTTIVSLNLEGNPLEGVPYLGKFGESLLWLEMANCGLNKLDPIAMSALRKMNLLNVGGNDFNTIPDVRPSPSSYIQMTISNNPITKITLESLMSMPQLRLLKVKNMNMKRLPNLCHTRLNGFIEQSASFPVYCDCHAQWIKIGVAAGLRFYGGSPECVYPPYLVGLPWHLVNLSDMVCTEQNRDFEINPVDPDKFKCFIPPVKQYLEVGSVFECAQRCIDHYGCKYFNIIQSNSTRICGLTDISGFNETDLIPEQLVIDEGDKWFTID